MVLVGNDLEVAGQLARRAKWEAGMIQNREKHWHQEAPMAAVGDLDRGYHLAVQ